MIKRRNKRGRPRKNPYQVARTQRAALFIDDFMKEQKIRRTELVDSMIDHEIEHNLKVHEKQNLFAWFYDMKEGKSAEPKKTIIFTLCNALLKWETFLDEPETDPFFIYLPLACRLHYAPFQPIDPESMEYFGVDWYFKIKNEFQFSEYFELIYEFIEPEDIAIDVAELLEEPIETWTEKIHDLHLKNFSEKYVNQNFGNRKEKTAYLILLDWLLFRDFLRIK